MANAARIEQKLALAAALGYGHALSDGDVGLEWGDAAADEPEQVPRLVFDANKERLSARIRARKGY